MKFVYAAVLILLIILLLGCNVISTTANVNVNVIKVHHPLEMPWHCALHTDWQCNNTFDWNLCNHDEKCIVDNEVAI